MSKYLCYIFLAFLSLVASPLASVAFPSSEGRTFRFRRHQVNDGLSENSVFCIMQDSRGYMWFGTKDGLNRFDGKNYRVFRPGAGLPFSPDNGFISTIAPLGTDSLLLGTASGVYIMDMISERFSAFDALTPDGKGITASVLSICIDSRGRIWFATNKEGLFIYTAEHGLRQYTDSSGEVRIPSSMVWVVYEDRIGSIWVGTRKGLLLYDEQTGDFIKQGDGSAEHIGDDEVMTITEDSAGGLWVGTWSGGLKKLDRGSRAYSATYLNSSSTPYITHIRTIFEYSPESLLIGSDDGLYMLHKPSGMVRRMDRQELPYSLGDQNVYSIYRDSEQGIWVGTYFGGVHYLLSENNSFETYTRDYTANSLTGNAVRQFCEDGSGNLWIATEDGGVNYFDPRSGKFTSSPFPQDVSYHNVHALLLAGNEFWIGTFSRGIDVLDRRTGRTLRRYRHDESESSSLSDDCIFSLYRTGDGTIWVGTPVGLNRYDPAGDCFVRIPQARNCFIYDIREDAFGNLWMATYGQGILRYDRQGDRWRQYLPDGNPASLSHNKVISIYIDGEQQLWFTTEGGGISRYDYHTDDFVSFTEEKDKLPNNVVYGILDDDDGNLWFTSNVGLTCFNPGTRRILRHFTRADGLQSNEFNYKAAYKSTDGKFYFGGINGFNAFYPDKLALNTHDFPVAITSISLLNNESPELEEQVMERVRNSSTVVLSHKNASFTLSFVALSYRAPEKNSYAYYMSGIDNGWHETGNSNSVTYVNLTPGHYTFRVKAANNDGVWNETGASLEIVIRPPIWATLAAKIGYAVFAIAAIWLVISYFIRRGRRLTMQRIARYKATQERENLTSKINFFTSVAHEIRTPLSLIHAPLEEVVNSRRFDDRARANLGIIERNTERLSELVNQLLDFRKLEAAGYDLKLAPLDLTAFMQELISNFAQTASAKQIDLRYEASVRNTHIVSDRDALTKVVYNLMSNAFKFTRDRIEVMLEETAPEEYRISVRDNGRGIPERLKEKIFEPFFQIEHSDKPHNGTGIGLSIAALMAEKLAGKLAIDSGAESNGAMFVFTFAATPGGAPATLHEPDAPTVEPSNTPLPTGEGEKRSILFVDDNLELRAFILHNMSDRYNIVTASDGKQAMAEMEKQYFDLVITDIMMPVVDGFSLVRQLKESANYCHIPIILLSAKSGLDFRVEGLQLGAEVFIEKPFSTAYLRAQIEALLSNRSRIFELFSRAPVSMYGVLTPNRRDTDLINKLNAEIESHITDTGFSIDLLAESFNMSRSNFQRKLKGICGMTPNDYLRTYRLKKAAELLAGKKYRINEICYLVGFANPSYFTKCFREHFGVLPRDFV